jgi:hypothetical protein
MKLLMRLKNGLLEVFFYKESVVNLVDWNIIQELFMVVVLEAPTYGSNYGTVFQWCNYQQLSNTSTGTSINMGNSTLLVVHHMQILC